MADAGLVVLRHRRAEYAIERRKLGTTPNRLALYLEHTSMQASRLATGAASTRLGSRAYSRDGLSRLRAVFSRRRADQAVLADASSQFRTFAQGKFPRILPTARGNIFSGIWYLLDDGRSDIFKRCLRRSTRYVVLPLPQQVQAGESWRALADLPDISDKGL